MKKALLMALIFGLGFMGLCFAQETKSLLIDDFEGPINCGPNGTVDFGAGGGSTLEVVAAQDLQHLGRQSLKVTYNAVPGGYIWIARGYGLDAQNAGWLVKPEDINWDKYQSISFYMYGSNSQASLAFDIKDNGGEIWRFTIQDDFKGWKEIACPFNQFLVRNDWQPDSAIKNVNLDFPLKSYQFEPMPPAQGTFYFDEVELIEK